MEQENLALEIQKALGEAGGVAWCELYGHKEVDGVNVTIKINLTARELNASLALESLINAIKEAEEKYKMRPYNLPRQPVKTEEDPFPVKQEPRYEPIKNEATGRTVNTNDHEEFNCVKFVSARYPKKEGWVKVDFYSSEPGKTKYPFMSSYLAIERAMAYLRPFGFNENDLVSGAEFPCDFQVWWKFDEKTNSAGNHYKSLVGISK